MRHLFDLCQFFYASHYLPVAAYRDRILLFRCSPLEEDLNVFFSAEGELFQQKKNPAVFSSADAGLYGRVHVIASGTDLLIGPVFSGEISPDAVYAFLRANTIPARFFPPVREFLAALPKYTYNQFLNLLAFLHKAVNGESVEILRHFSITDKQSGEKMAARYTERSAERKEAQSEHGTYHFEMLMLDYVRRGDTTGLMRLFDSVIRSMPMQEGTLAGTPLRQAKDLLIGLVTMVGKVGAIGGGMDVEEAYSLIDLYIQECEKTQSIDMVKTLQYNLVIDFTDRVERSHTPKNLSHDIYDCVKYIRNHTNAHVSLDDVATHIGKSRAYTTRKFKAETGKTINDYIIECKIEEACSLLKYAGLAISEISEYLAFASPPYFQNVFKARVGLTPAAYRNEAQRNLRNRE